MLHRWALNGVMVPMDLKTFYFGLSPEDREEFAIRCETTPGHMRNVAYGYKPASTELAVAIEKFSRRQVTRQEMFPSNFRKKWPELRSRSEVKEGA